MGCQLVEQVLNEIVDDMMTVVPVFYRRLTGFLQESGGDISHYHFATLIMLDQCAGLPVYEICRRLVVSKSQMTSVIDKLLSMGLVNRVQDDNDRRVFNISITDGGRDVLNNTRELFARSLAQKISLLDKAEIRSFGTSLKTIINIGMKLE